MRLRFQKQSGVDYVGRVSSRYGKRMRQPSRGFRKQVILSSGPPRTMELIFGGYLDNPSTGNALDNMLSANMFNAVDMLNMKYDIVGNQLGQTAMTGASGAYQGQHFKILVEHAKMEFLFKNSSTVPCWLLIMECHPKWDIQCTTNGLAQSKTPAFEMIQGLGNTQSLRSTSFTSSQTVVDNWWMINKPYLCEPLRTHYRIKFKRLRLIPGGEVKSHHEIRNKSFDTWRMLDPDPTGNRIISFKGLTIEILALVVPDIFYGTAVAADVKFATNNVTWIMNETFKYRALVEPRAYMNIGSDQPQRQNVWNPSYTTGVYAPALAPSAEA